MRYRRRHSLFYVIYLRSSLWRLRRRIWVIRAGGRCQGCHSRRRLTIHHRTYHRLGHERRTDVTVLCLKCHRRRLVEVIQIPDPDHVRLRPVRDSHQQPGSYLETAAALGSTYEQVRP